MTHKNLCAVFLTAALVATGGSIFSPAVSHAETGSSMMAITMNPSVPSTVNRIRQAAERRQAIIQVIADPSAENIAELRRTEALREGLIALVPETVAAMKLSPHLSSQDITDQHTEKFHQILMEKWKVKVFSSADGAAGEYGDFPYFSKTDFQLCKAAAGAAPVDPVTPDHIYKMERCFWEKARESDEAVSRFIGTALLVGLGIAGLNAAGNYAREKFRPR